MTPKRWILAVLTLLAISFLGLSLLGSWTQPQIQSRLELYQTNLLLHASQWQGKGTEADNLIILRDNLIGKTPVEEALKQYQQVQESAAKNLDKFQEIDGQIAEGSLQELEQLNRYLQLRIGILKTQLGYPDQAIETWKGLVEVPASGDKVSLMKTAKTAQVLIGLWQTPARLFPDAEPILQNYLEGWFRYQALVKLYTLQQPPEALVTLETQEQKQAETAIFKLMIVGAIPGLGLVTGLVLVIVLGIQLIFKGKDSILATNMDVAWLIPWNGEIILQVFVVGFSLLGQLFIPLTLRAVFQGLHLQPSSFDVRNQAVYILITYLLLMVGGFSVLYFSIKPYFPLPQGWFTFKIKDNWFVWGLGGYLVALPLVILVSLINQKLWDGQGGSNPLLPIALESRDSVALGIFFITASIAAPIFEETMFRGFLLPSLTRYLPLGSAILLSGFLFAVAHFNVSEILPLMTLGIVLGFVYTRSRNLLAPMFMHGLWNSGTLLSLYVLGSGGS
ncbi:MAG TPA: CPBP family intramembrane metalloprotease domain-containing protein [Planktothrix sp. UBA8407]|jgi:Predicted metal-dependent membrane protease|nr:CPBP family intramembrane metalloprotease domain-containing protein [Planktothrix sp. UBA8402]HAO13212.1 CPBP family intramembrane metalloprotease domain-containing protein [Planktothrix sp. UBA8407]HBK24864.1 CPBP family intramembrane metalloprotease domain-containing protein [Planktothrix sp. UBA10369]